MRFDGAHNLHFKFSFHFQISEITALQRHDGYQTLREKMWHTEDTFLPCQGNRGRGHLHRQRTCLNRHRRKKQKQNIADKQVTESCSPKITGEYHAKIRLHAAAAAACMPTNVPVVWPSRGDAICTAADKTNGMFHEARWRQS